METDMLLPTVLFTVTLVVNIIGFFLGRTVFSELTALREENNLRKNENHEMRNVIARHSSMPTDVINLEKEVKELDDVVAEVINRLTENFSEDKAGREIQKQQLDTLSQRIAKLEHAWDTVIANQLTSKH
jgi:hypothetical protein